MFMSSSVRNVRRLRETEKGVNKWKSEKFEVGSVGDKEISREKDRTRESVECVLGVVLQGGAAVRRCGPVGAW